MTALTDETRLTRNPDLIAAEMDGDLVMMSIDKGEYYGVGGVGPRIWALLEQAVTLPELTRTIAAEFDVEEARCRGDLEAFIRQMLEMGLISSVAI